jgi:hypothetical protein
MSKVTVVGFGWREGPGPENYKTAETVRDMTRPEEQFREVATLACEANTLKQELTESQRVFNDLSGDMVSLSAACEEVKQMLVLNEVPWHEGMGYGENIKGAVELLIEALARVRNAKLFAEVNETLGVARDRLLKEIPDEAERATWIDAMEKDTKVFLDLLAHVVIAKQAPTGNRKTRRKKI